ncbi:MAG: response regulator [Odoribacteraceae bacterium]|jgi:signal transduction histidine kinase/ligand-binding sensor domain-containing protein/DNA-binding response OmpR family regulator|nr:response regulator [Odoribacteraceae bacterium]
MKRALVSLLVAAALFACPRALFARGIPSGYLFSTLTVDDGLPHNYVDDIFKDSRGFLWISTGGGLARHDGYECLLFDVNSSPVALKSNVVIKAREDAFQRLWVISNGGLDIIDLRAARHCPRLHDNPLLALPDGLHPVDILVDAGNNIWILSNETLYKITLDANGDIRHSGSVDRPGPAPFTALRDIDGTVHVACAGKIYTVTPALPAGLSLHRACAPVDFGENAHVSSLLKKENSIWIGTNNGLFRHNLNDGSTDAFLHDERDPASISQNTITDLLLLDDGLLVVATLRGLNFFDAANATFRRVSCNDPGENTLNNDFINCLVADGPHLWIGTEAGGVNKMTPPRLPARHYLHDENLPASLSGNPVNAVLEDRHGHLWVGTVEGGLNCKRAGQEGFIHYTADRGQLVHNSVSALEEDAEGYLWVGTWGGGISILEQVDGELSRVRDISLETNFIGILKHDTLNNGTWVGTHRDVYFIDHATRRVHAPLPPALTREIRGSLGCAITRDDHLWLGTSAGVLRVDLRSLDPGRTSVAAAFLSTGDPRVDRLLLPRVSCIFQDHAGNVWIGSSNLGVYRLPGNADGLPRHYTTADGLPNNTIFGILEDEKGIIWISSARGLSALDPATGLCANYTTADGLPGNQFYWNAAGKSPAGKLLYFGGTRGLTCLDPTRPLPPAPRPRLAFTRLVVLDKPITPGDNPYLPGAISGATRVTLHERDKSFSIEFSALDYYNPSTVDYAYRLVGFDDKWIPVAATRRFATYTSLRPGTYTFQARAISPGNPLPGDVASIEIVVRPFFYKTTWFIALLASSALLLLLLAHRLRYAALRERQRLLQVEVTNRTRALEEQKRLLEGQAIELKLQNTALKVQNEQISLQRKQIIDMAAKVEEATNDRISFFTNITHEFRTPITLITGPVERALKLSYNPLVIEQLRIAARNSRHLLSLVNQLMDFRKVEAGHLSVRLENGNLPAFLDEILLPFESFITDRRISLRRLYRLPASRLLFDPDATRKLVTNLLGNAIKFTPDDGTITLYAAVLPPAPGRLYLCVSDTGTGIRDEDLERVFERFFQSKGESPRAVHGQSGTGIGLYLCKSLVELLGGTIRARNNRARGASFRVVLPLQPAGPARPPATPLPPPPAAPAPGPARGETTVLLVEDDADTRAYITSILRDRYRVLEAVNGEEALRLLAARPVDLIISDLMMPLVDGLELSRRVKNDLAHSHLPFLLLTARADNDTRLASYRAGVDEFLSKPFDEEILLARVDNILARREALRRRFLFHVNVDDLDLPVEPADKRFIRRVFEVLKERHPDPAFDVGDFASAMKTSKSLLNKKMQALAGQPAGQFIRDYRLNTAREILLATAGNLTVSEIAYTVGFNDPKYFTRCFTRHFGVAPSQARPAAPRPPGETA